MEAVGAAAALALKNAASRPSSAPSSPRCDLAGPHPRAGDAERRAFERDLHDGAQQRLLGIRLALQLARGQLDDGGVTTVEELLAEADTEVLGALDELRAPARVASTRPCSPTRDSAPPSPRSPGASPFQSRSPYSPERLPATVEATAYFVASEALANVVKHAHATKATIDIGRANGCVAMRSPTTGSAAPTPTAPGFAGSETRRNPRRTPCGRQRSRPRHTRHGGDPMRVILADDAVIVRQGLARLLADREIDVVAQAGDADELLQHVAANPPDVAVIDIRMPPTHTTEGLIAAQHDPAPPPAGRHRRPLPIHRGRLRPQTPHRRLPNGLGYLLKDRIADVNDFISTLEVVAAGGTIVEPTLVSELLAAPAARHPLAALTPVSTTCSPSSPKDAPTAASPNSSTSPARPSKPTFAASCASSISPPTPPENRRVHAVLAFLRQTDMRNVADSDPNVRP